MSTDSHDDRHPQDGRGGMPEYKAQQEDYRAHVDRVAEQVIQPPGYQLSGRTGGQGRTFTVNDENPSAPDHGSCPRSPKGDCQPAEYAKGEQCRVTAHQVTGQHHQHGTWHQDHEKDGFEGIHVLNRCIIMIIWQTTCGR